MKKRVPYDLESAFFVGFLVVGWCTSVKAYFEMESDSLCEDIEEVYFDAEEWSEEGMDVDLH